MSFDYKMGEWTVEPARGRLTRDGVVRKLEPRHMRVLTYLLRHPGKQIASATLLQEAYRNKTASENSLSIVIRDLREALDDLEEPSAYIRTVPEKGFLLVANVTRVEADPKPKQSGLNRKLFVSASLVALLVFFLQNQRTEEELVAIEEPITFLALFPIRDESNSPQGSRLAQGLDAIIRNRIGPIDPLKVLVIPPKFGDQMPENLGLQAKIEGSLALKGQELVLKLSITRLDPLRPHWSKTLRGPVSQSLELERQLARELVQILKPTHRPTKGEEKIVDPASYEALLEGYALLSEGHYGEALTFFDRARQVEPSFAEPYLGLALTGIQLNQADPQMLYQELPGIQALLEKALSLKPDLAEAHATLGMLLFQSGWSFEASERHFLKALALNPNNSETQRGLAMFYLTFSRFESAAEHLAQASKLDPFSHSPDVAWMYSILGDEKAASKELELCALEDERSPAVQATLIKLFEGLGRETDALRHYKQMMILRGYTESDLAEAEAVFKEHALSGLNHWFFDRKETRDLGQYEPPLAYARYLAVTSDKDQSFAWLTNAVKARQPELLWLNVDPKYDGLRSDPRFTELVHQIGLDYIPALTLSP